MKRLDFKNYNNNQCCLLIFILCLFLLPNWINAAPFEADASSAATELTIAYRLDSAPMQFQNDRGQADGILIDLWRLWSIKSGIPVKFIGAYNKEAQQMVKDGRADINAGLFESKKRAEFLDFSNPILDSPYYLFYQPSLSVKQSIEEFKDLAIGVTRGSFHENYLKQHYPHLKLALFDGYRAMFMAARNKDIKAFVTQPHYLKYHLDSEPGQVNYQRLEPELYSRNYKASVSKGNDRVLNLVNQNLARISVEDRRVILQHWLGKLSTRRGDDNMLQLTAEEKQWLMAHPIIEIGVDGNWPPIDFINSKGEHSGIVSDMMAHIARQLNVQFKVAPGPTFKDMLAKVRRGELKVAATVVKTSERSNDLWFSEPFFTAEKVIIARQDARSFLNARALFGKTVAIENGFSTMKQLQEKYPEIILRPVSSTLDALKDVSLGKVDAYIGNGAVAQWLIQAHQISNLEFSGDPDLEPAPQRFAIHRDERWKPLLGILDKALARIDSRQKNSIYQQWLGIAKLPRSIVKKMDLTEAERRWLSNHSEMRLGIDPSWPPIEFVDSSGRYQGLSSEFINVIADSLNLHLAPVSDLSWEEVMSKARDKELDLLPAVVKSAKRDEFLNFTEPYLDFPFVIFVRDQQGFAAGLTDLYGKNVAVEKAYITQEYLQRDYPEINLVLVNDTLEGLKKVSLGVVDAYVGNLTVGSYLLSKYGINNVKVGGTTPYNYELSIGVRKDWPELVTILNKFFQALSNEEKSQIRQKWLSVKYDVQVDDTIIRRIVFGASILLFLSLIWIMLIKRKQKRLRQSEEQLNLIINTIPLAIVLTSEDGTIVKANPYVAEELHTTEEVVGRNMAALYDDHSERQQILGDLQAKGVVKDMQVHFRTDAGDVVTGLLSVIPVRFGKRLLNLGMFVNLTERLEMEQALKKAKESSEQASQFKSDFLANMSHEIRTPMNAIIGMTHLALQTALTDKQYNYIHKVKISAHNLLGIINDVLDFSKVEAGKLSIESTDFFLDDVLDNLANMVALKAEEKNLEILFNRDMMVPDRLVGDPLRLGQVLINLVQNAIKFTVQGQVVVTVELLENLDEQVKIKFSVSDSGIGIESDRIKQLFEPFVQADSSISRKHGGTGLGLSISKQIVELMGGQLSVTSAPGKGSCFSFSLGFEKQKNADSRFHELEPELEVLMPELKVLLIDDNPVALKILRDMLESFSFTVDIAESAEQAYHLLQQQGGLLVEHPEPYELVLVDWWMPEINGIEAAHHIHYHLPLTKKPKIILITAYGREEIMQQAENTPLDGFLIKPITPSTLFDTIISIFQNKAVRRYRTSINHSAQRLSGKVLLVEDNAINQQVARELLEGFGLLVVIAANGRDAINCIHETAYDLILMDIQMPIMDGLEATQLIRAQQQYASLPIIAMTAHAMAGDKELCLEAGMTDYLSKPIDPEMLLQTLQKYLPKVSNKPLYSEDTDDTDGLFPDALPGIDLIWGLHRVGGNKQLFAKLLRDFVNSYDNCCEELRQSLAIGDMEAVRRLVHIIHGVAGNIGAHEFQQSASVIESAIRENNDCAEQCTLLSENFCQQASTIFAELKSLFRQWDEVEAFSGQIIDNGTTEFLHQDSQALPEMMMQLEKSLLEGDSSARVTMESLKNMINSDSLSFNGMLVERLEQQVNDYDYEDALKTLAELKEI